MLISLDCGRVSCNGQYQNLEVGILLEPDNVFFSASSPPAEDEKRDVDESMNELNAVYTSTAKANGYIPV